MYLIKKNMNSEETKVDVIFEKVVDDLLLISITNSIRNDGILSYWRLIKVIGIPPLEIGIDCKSGGVVSITFYIDVSYIKEQESLNVHTGKGNILVDTNIFTNVNDYIDIDQGYKVGIQANKLICLFEGVDEFKQSYRNERFEIYLDSKDQIVGFGLCDLTEEEIETINSL